MQQSYRVWANNYDVRIVAQRILEQQAQVKITRSQQFPTVTVGGTGIGATLPASLGTQIGNPLVDGSFNLSAAWTPDFWGLYRRQTEAARAQLLAQKWAQREVRLTLVQQVATAVPLSDVRQAEQLLYAATSEVPGYTDSPAQSGWPDSRTSCRCGPLARY
jgi:multidrug efflux system outer membrane protein